jgi:hypothetical protein
MNSAYQFLKSAFALIGVLLVLVFTAEVFSVSSGTGWKWNKESQINHVKFDSTYVAIERGRHNDAVDRVRVVLISDGIKRELWSSYMKTEPEVSWVNDTTVGIIYNKEESHSYWPEVTLDQKIYEVQLSYR